MIFPKKKKRPVVPGAIPEGTAITQGDKPLAPEKPKIQPAPMTAEQKGAYSNEQSNKLIAAGGVLADNPKATAQLAAEKGIVVNPASQSIVKGKMQPAQIPVGQGRDTTKDFMRYNSDNTVDYAPAGQPIQHLTVENYRKLDQANEAADRNKPANQSPEQKAAVQGLDMQQPGLPAPESDTSLGSSFGGILPEMGASIGQKALTAGGVGLLSSGGNPVVGGVAAAGGAIYAAFDIVGNLKAEEMQKVKVEYKDARTATTNLKASIVYAKTGDPMDARRLYDAEWAKIRQAESNLQVYSEREWLSKAKDEQIAVANLLASKIQYDSLFEIAISKNTGDNFDFSSVEGLPGLAGEEAA